MKTPHKTHFPTPFFLMFSPLLYDVTPSPPAPLPPADDVTRMFECLPGTFGDLDLDSTDFVLCNLDTIDLVRCAAVNSTLHGMCMASAVWIARDAAATAKADAIRMPADARPRRDVAEPLPRHLNRMEMAIKDFILQALVTSWKSKDYNSLRELGDVTAPETPSADFTPHEPLQIPVRSIVALELVRCLSKRPRAKLEVDLYRTVARLLGDENLYGSLKNLYEQKLPQVKKSARLLGEQLQKLWPDMRRRQQTAAGITAARAAAPQQMVLRLRTPKLTPRVDVQRSRKRMEQEYEQLQREYEASQRRLRAANERLEELQRESELRQRAEAKCRRLARELQQSSADATASQIRPADLRAAEQRLRVAVRINEAQAARAAKLEKELRARYGIAAKCVVQLEEKNKKMHADFVDLEIASTVAVASEKLRGDELEGELESVRINFAARIAEVEQCSQQEIDIAFASFKQRYKEEVITQKGEGKLSPSKYLAAAAVASMLPVGSSVLLPPCNTSGKGRGVEVTRTLHSMKVEVGARQTRRRVNLVGDIIDHTAGGAEHRETLLRAQIKAWRREYGKLGVKTEIHLSVEQTAALFNEVPGALANAFARHLRSCGVRLAAKGKVAEYFGHSHHGFVTGSRNVADPKRPGKFKTMAWLHVNSLIATWQTMVYKQAEAGTLEWAANIPHDEMWGILLVDKGSTTTKLELKCAPPAGQPCVLFHTTPSPLTSHLNTPLSSLQVSEC